MSESEFSLRPNDNTIEITIQGESIAPSNNGSASTKEAKPPKGLFSSVKHQAKIKTKKLLDGVKDTGSESDDDDESEKENVLEVINENPAFNLSRLVEKKSTIRAKTAKKALQTIGSSIIHPKSTIKNKATRSTARELSKAERPYLSTEADLEFVEAHNDLQRVETTHGSQEDRTTDGYEAIISASKDKIKKLEEHRESMRAAWVTSRHVRRARTVPRGCYTFPKRSSYLHGDKKQNVERFDWINWLGHLLLYYSQDFSTQYIDDYDDLPFDINALRHNIERLAMASAPWQVWFMNVRSVYRWENPKVTAKWLALYLVLWYTQHLMGFLYAYILYIVLKQRFNPSSIESLRSSMQRALNSRTRAHQISELVDKHGKNDWLDPLIDELGPHIQLQVGDLANMFEVLFNFYHWNSPWKTFGTLTFFASCLLVSIFTDMAYCVKIVWFIAGGSFFLCYPVSSRYPKYRYLVSPVKWILWDIPTHSEWSFQYLQGQAKEARRLQAEQKIANADKRLKIDSTQSHTHGSLAVEDVGQEFPKTNGASKIGNEPNSLDSDAGSVLSFQSAQSSTSFSDAIEVRSFRAYLAGGAVGYFSVLSNGIRFVHSRLSLRKSVSRPSPQDQTEDSDQSNEAWYHPFSCISEIRKFNDDDKNEAGSSLAGRLVNKVSSLADSKDEAGGGGAEGGGLEIRLFDATRLTLRGMRQRDEAFNAVIAFSGVQWQSLQDRPT